MVRVFSIYQFDGQSIHRIPGDIRSASLIDADQLALAKSDHVIEIISLKTDQMVGAKRISPIHDASDDTNIRTKYAFPTVDEIIEMVYCQFGKEFLCISHGRKKKQPIYFKTEFILKSNL